MQRKSEMLVWSLAPEEPLQEEMATHSNILAWKIPWTEEPCRLQSMVWQRMGHDWGPARLGSFCVVKKRGFVLVSFLVCLLWFLSGQEEASVCIYQCVYTHTHTSVFHRMIGCYDWCISGLDNVLFCWNDCRVVLFYLDQSQSEWPGLMLRSVKWFMFISRDHQD